MVTALRSEIQQARAYLTAGGRPSNIANLLHAHGLSTIQLLLVFKEATGASLADLKSFGQWWGSKGVTDEAAFNAWSAEVLSRSPRLTKRSNESGQCASVPIPGLHELGR